MTAPKRRQSALSESSPRTVRIILSFDEISTLVRLANYYGRGLGFVQRAIQVVSPGEMRIKARFVQEESYWLKRFAEANRDRMALAPDSSSPVEFTPRALLAFYGRTLGTLNVPRTRRRLSPTAIEQREALAAKLHASIVTLNSSDPKLVHSELDTRRMRERQWIEDALRDPSAEL